MAIIDQGDGMIFDTETGLLTIEGLDESIQTIPLSDDELEGLNDWHKILEEGEKKKGIKHTNTYK